ncbi:MAG TPA: hypothetical protein VH186_21490 [Chloroflexia bacterium]|nr:hypothetical protein [Chloroflexia bacterium]
MAGQLNNEVTNLMNELNDNNAMDAPANLGGNENEIEIKQTKSNREKIKNKPDYHVRAGRIGGETTKQRHRDSNFYKQIGALGGTTTMARHGQEYEERRKKGGLTTRERYGEEYYHNIAAKAARTKQDATRLRNDAIKALLSAGFKIPTIIKLTWKDVQDNPTLLRLSQENPLAEYLKDRTEEGPLADEDKLFVSQSGKPLSLANTYTVMERHKAAEEE